MELTHFESLYPDTTRFAELEKLLVFIKAGNSAQVVSIPGAGRSTFFGLLAYNRNIREKHLAENQKWFHFVMVDFSQIRKKPLLDATKLIFISLVNSLKSRKMDEEYEKANGFLKEAISLNDELLLFQNLQKTIELLAIEKELTVVLLMDRFHEYIPMLSSDFFRNLKSLRNKAKYRFSVVLSLNRPLEDSLEEQVFSDFYEFLENHTIYLSILDKTALDFQISYVEKVSNKKLTEKIKEDIVTLTNGHSKLTKLCIELALNNESGIKNNEYLEQKTILKTLENIWKALTPSEQFLLAKNQESGIKNNGLDYLEKIGLVENNKITIPLFSEYIKKLQTMQQFSNKTIVYNQSTNEITKGEVAISHGLSAMEFRLLKFCVENPNRILEREEIINAVWKDAKATAGVSDQALDQLIFRLRKKIENDPNNPIHLKTIKGRGFSFLND